MCLLGVCSVSWGGGRVLGLWVTGRAGWHGGCRRENGRPGGVCVQPTLPLPVPASLGAPSEGSPPSSPGPSWICPPSVVLSGPRPPPTHTHPAPAPTGLCAGCSPGWVLGRLKSTAQGQLQPQGASGGSWHQPCAPCTPGWTCPGLRSLPISLRLLLPVVETPSLSLRPPPLLPKLILLQ